MFFGWLKRYMPRGIYGRAALIVLLPVVVLQLVVSIVFLQRHFDGVTRQMSATMVRELAYVDAQLDGAPDRDTAMARASGVAQALDLAVTFVDDPAQQDRRPFYDISGSRVIEVLRAQVPDIVSIDLMSDPRAVTVVLNTPHGPVQITFPRAKVSASNPHQLLVLMLVAGLLMSAISIIFLRNQMRPIRRLAAAAEAFGRGQNMPLRQSGASEVRAAGAAFLDMRSRIERQIEQRTLMLSGVSHDLRTPLTRIRLALSVMPDSEDADEIRRDLDEMEGMLDAFLSFARSDALDDPEPCDPVSLAQDAVTRAERAGGSVRMGTVDGKGTMRLRPQALGRALDNLINNALRYGGQAVVSVALTERSLRLRVEDDGPGIAEQQRDDALKPFVRLDAARNQNAGSGVGLGLAITADIARRHGGLLRLGDSEALGGLCADIVLPR